MKKLMMACCIMAIAFCVIADTETVDGITWTYTVDNGCASVGSDSYVTTAVPTLTSGDIVIPSLLGDKLWFWQGGILNFFIFAFLRC